MSLFKKIKLDPNFEQWLDQKIFNLKAEGVITSDTEEITQENLKDRTVTFAEEENFAWGVEHHKNCRTHETLSEENNYTMAQETGTINPPLGKERDISESLFTRLKSDKGKDYYQFVWEDDEEASVFDREAYQLSNRKNQNIQPKGQSETQNKHEDVYCAPQVSGTGKTSKLAQLGGLVLGIKQTDMKVAYTQLQECNNGPANDSLNLHINDLNKGQGPDPRFSIADETDANTRVSFAESNFGAHRFESGVTGYDLNLKPENAKPQGGTSSEYPPGIYSGKFSNVGRQRDVMLKDSLEMNMSSEDDEEILDDLDVHSEMAPDNQVIVTVDQATLVQQWRAKSKRTQFLILASVGSLVILVFGLVVLIVVKLLQASV